MCIRDRDRVEHRPTFGRNHVGNGPAGLEVRGMDQLRPRGRGEQARLGRKKGTEGRQNSDDQGRMKRLTTDECRDSHKERSRSLPSKEDDEQIRSG